MNASHATYVVATPLFVLLLVGILGPREFTTGHGKDPAQSTRFVVFGVDDAVFEFVLYRRRLPSNLDELLLPSPRTGRPLLDRVPTDGWGRSLAYRVLNEGRMEREVRSAGPDGRMDTADDVVHPEPRAEAPPRPGRP